jgi:hypothetical protein
MSSTACPETSGAKIQWIFERDRVKTCVVETGIDCSSFVYLSSR